MKKYLFTVLLILPFLINSCGVNSENPASAAESGNVYFSFSKTNAPENVSSVEVKLTRQNFEPIIRQMNLTSDSTANLMIPSVATGSWHLKIDAKNNSNEIVYTGEADVVVQANFITQVTLTLNPTGGGGVQTGSVNISVNWGTPAPTPSGWVDFPQNPLIVPTNSYYDNKGVRQGFVFYDNGKFKMFYLGLTYSAKSYICYAESNDGINWTYPLQNPVISPTDSMGWWDSHGVSAGPVIKINGVYHMYYCGWPSSDVNARWSIGLATSADGINWVKRPQPVVAANSIGANQIGPNSILKIGDYYYLYYTNRNYPNYNIGVMKSLNGVDFTPATNTPVLVPTLPWEGTGVNMASVIKDGDGYKMVYGAGVSSSINNNLSCFGFATSPNGLTWTKSEIPIFDNTKTSNGWGRFDIAYPNLIKTDSEYRVYYSADGNGSTIYRIGMMRKPL